MFLIRMELAGFYWGLTMHRDETSLHPDTGVTSVMFVERSLNEIRFGLES